MRDDRSDEDAEPSADDPASMLEGLDEGFENLDPLDEHPPSASPLSRREIDELVNQVLNEALSRLDGEKSEP